MSLNFDWSISIGNLLTILGVLLLVWRGYFNIALRLTKLEILFTERTENIEKDITQLWKQFRIMKGVTK